MTHIQGPWGIEMKAQTEAMAKVLYWAWRTSNDPAVKDDSVDAWWPMVGNNQPISRSEWMEMAEAALSFPTPPAAPVAEPVGDDRTEGFIAGYDEGLRQSKNEAGVITTDALEKAKVILKGVRRGALTPMNRVLAALDAVDNALSASPSPVDSRELIERLVKALEEIAASRRMNCHEMSDEERAEYWSALALRYRSIASKALAAKEQQP